MKRTRFTAHLSNGEKRVILAYDPYTAGAYYRSLGYEVDRVTKGDFRRDARKAEQRPTGARPNMRAIREAIEFLGITLPVEVKVTTRKGGRYGAHTPIPTGGNAHVRNGRVSNLATATGWKHSITVKAWLTVEQMGETLWHELAHAMQFERDARPGRQRPEAVLRAWKTAYCDGTAYDRKPHEVEARSYEGFNSESPLAR